MTGAATLGGVTAAYTMIRRAWRAFWQPWRVAFVSGAVAGMATMYAIDHPNTPMRSAVGLLVALGVLPWIAMLASSRSGARDDV